MAVSGFLVSMTEACTPQPVVNPFNFVLVQKTLLLYAHNREVQTSVTRIILA